MHCDSFRSSKHCLHWSRIIPKSCSQCSKSWENKIHRSCGCRLFTYILCAGKFSMQAGVWKCMPQYIWWVCEMVHGEKKGQWKLQGY